MNQKIRKYLLYFLNFSKSPDKLRILKHMGSAIWENGFVQGIQHYLHTHTDELLPGYDKESAYEPVYSTSEKDDRYKIVLPLVEAPTVSIIIPVYNHVLYAYYCVRSIWEYHTEPNYEIIIADDNSPEKTDFLDWHLVNAIFIRNATNLGFLKNCNHAARHARGQYIVLLNNDINVRKGWLSELLRVFQDFDNVALVGSKLVYPDGRLQEAGGIIWKDGSGWNFGNQDDPEKPEYNYVKEADYISGASIMIRKTVWDEIGGFDERYSPAYCEDSDLCFAIREKGYRAMYQPFSEVVHFEGVSHGKDLNSGIKQYQVINNKKLFEKWEPVLSKKSTGGENVFFERDRSLGKKHILIADHNLPTPDRDAGSRTMANFVDCLLSLGLAVHFVSTNPDPELKYRKPLQKKGVEVIYAGRVHRAGYTMDAYVEQNYRNYDFILLSRSSVCLSILRFLRRNNYNGKIIYYGHDLGFRRLHQEALMKNDVDLDWEAKKNKADEDFMYDHADESLLISFDELNYMKGYVKKPLHYIPPYFFDVKPQTPPFSHRQGLMFIGGFNHTPNQDAVRWFMEDVYPLLSEKQIPLFIAGSAMPGFIKDYSHKFPLVTALPDIAAADLDKLYETVRLSIIPLRVGAGVKGKAIEAMANGVPIVGTTIAFEGMPRDTGFPYTGADTAEAFARNVWRLYQDGELWDQYAAFGKEYVAHDFNRDSMREVWKGITYDTPAVS